LVRVISANDTQWAKQVPIEILSFTPPIAYDSDIFSVATHGTEGRCSYCLLPARTMSPTGRQSHLGKQRWLAFCEVHDRQRRWVCDRRCGDWWYLPPPLCNKTEFWWRLTYHGDGMPGGVRGWYLHELGGSRIVDVGTAKLHRARAVSESHLATSTSEHSDEREQTS
jgi:hypothetical protein